MKKLIFSFIALLLSAALFAQVAGTRWKAKLVIENPVNVIIDFGKDTCSLYTVFDSSILETMHYSVTDTVLTVKKIDGQSDCDEATVGKYRYYIKDGFLHMFLLSDDCSDRSSVLDNTKWIPWIIPPELKMDSAVLKQYTGVYELDEAHPINITFEGGRLQIEGPNNGLPKSPLIAETSTRFFLKAAGVEFDFVKDANGNVVSLISHEDKDYELKKVK